MQNSLIASSAYKALSAFSTEEYTILHLPEEVRISQTYFSSFYYTNIIFGCELIRADASSVCSAGIVIILSTG